MDVSALVLRDGVSASAVGRVAAYQGNVWFEPWLPIPTVGYGPGQRPPPRPSGLGVLTRGVDLDRLAFREEKDGGIAGGATLTWIWRDGALDAVEQTEEWHERDTGVWPSWRTPPCPPPVDGWPQVRAGSNLDPNLPDSIPGMVSVAMFRPTATQVVLVVATSEPDAAEAMLRPLYGNSLCVVLSRWSPDQVEAVRSVFHKNWTDWGLYQLGDDVGEDAQVTVTAKVVHVVPALAEWFRTLPDGIANVTPWLSPIDSTPTQS